MSSINFQPFQQLYQGLKKNINLFNTLDRIHQYLQDACDGVDAINAGSAPNITITGSVTVASYTLTSSLGINITPTSSFLLVILTQDATGGHITTFSSATFMFPPTGLSTKAGTVSYILFVANGSYWYPMIPVTNKP